MTFRLNYRHLQSYLTFYYGYLPKIKKDENKQSLDVNKSTPKLKSIAGEHLDEKQVAAFHS